MDYAAARQSMVNCQILPNNVTNPSVIDGMLVLPREEFVPEELKGVAYVDESLPLGSGRYLMEPMVAARLLETVAPATDDVALSIGCASGYLPALLARIVPMLWGIPGALVAISGPKLPQAETLEAELGIEQTNDNK